MTNEQAIKWLKEALKTTDFQYEQMEKAVEMAIQALSQKPCELLIIKSNILLHQEDRKKWMESIKQEKENGVIILPPYFEPLLVPNDIEISIEQKPKTGKWNTFELFQNGIKETWYECPKCKWSNALLIPRKFCPNCGAKMESEEQTE